MNNREKIREWVFKRFNIKRIKGFKPMAIVKELNIPIEEVYKYCEELVVKDKILKSRYYFECSCEFSNIYDSLFAIPNRCEWCEKDIDKVESTSVEFAFIR